MTNKTAISKMVDTIQKAVAESKAHPDAESISIEEWADDLLVKALLLKAEEREQKPTPDKGLVDELREWWDMAKDDHHIDKHCGCSMAFLSILSRHTNDKGEKV
jgi:ABC-type nitrate/sulfonate/bicarbonate transport system substrate-binding protein